MTQVIDKAAIEQVASEVELDTGNIPVSSGGNRVDYSEVLELAQQLGASPDEIHSLALRAAVADGSGVKGVTSAHYRAVLAFILRLREEDESQDEIDELLNLLEQD